MDDFILGEEVGVANLDIQILLPCQKMKMDAPTNLNQNLLWLLAQWKLRKFLVARLTQLQF
jgi:hypothetical protein